ncbi:MAG: HepT-like ribonuclease domain-containing protein [Acidobacteriota bacterium]|jgi:uncharacterized protein YutE (UPF0331/DUF86 family)
MAPQPIKSQSIIPRLDGIARDRLMLQKLGELPDAEFAKEENFVCAQFYLRRALEGVFHIGSHILSRIPGGRVTEYKAIALKLGEIGIVHQEFANKGLKAMAGYRNRLTHFYADVNPAELHRILRHDLADFDTFAAAIKALLEHPESLGLVVE